MPMGSAAAALALVKAPALVADDRQRRDRAAFAILAFLVILVAFRVSMAR